MKAARDGWLDSLRDLSLRQFVFVDEFGATTQMQRTHGRAAPGVRVVSKVPHGHWKTLSTIAALTTHGIACSATFDGATDADTFLAFVEKALVPSLRPGQVVVMDNLSAHKDARVRERVEGVPGCRLLYLPPYSPDFNPIEQAISKVKSALRSSACRDVGLLYDVIAAALATITRADAKAFMIHSGYAIR